MRYIDLGNKKVIDSHLDRLDTRGVSRRDFTKLVYAGFAAGVAAEISWRSHERLRRRERQDRVHVLFGNA